MKEIDVTDQRPRTTHLTEMPEWAKAKAPLPKDETVQEFIQKLREQFKARVRKSA